MDASRWMKKNEREREIGRQGERKEKEDKRSKRRREEKRGQGWWVGLGGTEVGR